MKSRLCSQLTDAATTATTWVKSTCGLCSLGCGLEIAVAGERIQGVRGRVDHPVGKGRLGPKGLAQWQANHHPSRGLVPRMRDATGAMVDATWDEAMSRVVRHLEETIALDGPDAVAFYNSGQLVLEEYYTLAKLARAGIGTASIDASTRMCSATAGESLVQSFGADGAPGCFEDLDQTDCVVLFGHNAAEQSTVLWMRILAAKDGPRRPRVIAIDPRRTFTVATGADLHLAPRPGTNLALVNGLCALLIQHGWIDREFIRDRTTGFAEVAATVAPYTPEHVERITGVPADQLRRAARWIGTSERTVTTCLQGVYQSNQATATACAVNTMHLLMGKIGKPGSAPFQLAGQPSSMNTRECGADGGYPGHRDWANPAHMSDLARRWNVPVELLGKPSVSATEIFDQCTDGQVGVLFVIGSNPAVSAPDRGRRLDGLRDVFLVVMDPFADTETARLADVYLPTAMWGEKTGCMTSAERRCNLVQRAVAPPGQARTDLEVLIDLSRRMRLTANDGAPLIGYHDARGAFDEWRRISTGTIPDYSAMTYEAILARGGLQWPCDHAHPNGTPRLYADGRFATADGRARLLAARYQPPAEDTDDLHPLMAITGRQAYQWDTRTKTGKVPGLAAAAPGVFVGLNRGDADRLGIADGDLVKVSARRGHLIGPAKVGDVVPAGSVFVPFHHGDLDRDEAANALTPQVNDPVSRQPVQKLAAVRIDKLGDGVAWWRTP